MCQTVEPEEADGMTGTGILYETRQDTTETDIINRWSDHLARCQTQKNQKKPKPKQKKTKKTKAKTPKKPKKNPFPRNFRNKTLLGMFFFGFFGFFWFWLFWFYWFRFYLYLNPQTSTHGPWSMSACPSVSMSRT